MSSVQREVEVPDSSWQYAPGIVRGTLTSMQAVEVFQLALEMTKGDELALLLWRKSERCNLCNVAT